MKKIIKYFFQGLLYIVPISVTLYVPYWAFNKINAILPFEKYPGLGFIILIALIIFIGFTGSIIIASPINAFFQKLLKKVPLLQTIYSSMKDLMRTFVGRKKGFEKAVLIKVYENSTIERIGFITSEDLTSLEIKEGKVLVYLPHSYAISGQLFVVERSYITPLDKSSTEVMKLIISGGITEIEN
jgi:uncharacterized membrane protein